MNIDNNIGGSAQHSRSQHIEKRQTETVTPEQQETMLSGGKISFVNALQSTSLANVLWTVSNDAADESSATQSIAGTSTQLEAAWLRQAYTEH
ncbi:hypothetical protein [Agrobacterium rosae]|uniref:Uncharacterized protein n=1 Tax=Agrobacterium rosae TaxID=1972867 RepID=A0AAW9FJ29_9HYPH|nr:hypothetical protein [Agrobacterium rosae]MDX8303176.1 hypothetical protein [Agrobacterium rosae]MDX8315240.1 hypothetical protein [Agrobacterium rosae]